MCSNKSPLSVNYWHRNRCTLTKPKTSTVCFNDREEQITNNNNNYYNYNYKAGNGSGNRPRNRNGCEWTITQECFFIMYEAGNLKLDYKKLSGTSILIQCTSDRCIETVPAGKYFQWIFSL